MCENIKIVSDGEDYEDAVLSAMIHVKDALPEESHVFRDPEDCNNTHDWYLKHSDCELSPGGTRIGGLFVFGRNYGEAE